MGELLPRSQINRAEIQNPHYLTKLSPEIYSCFYIECDAVAENYRRLLAKCPSSKVSAVVKANAYGMGAIPLSKVLMNKGCDTFFVAYLDEGIALRTALGPLPHIYVLNGFWPGLEKEFLTYSLTPVITDINHLRPWQVLAQERQEELPIAIHLDTGMRRTGIPPEQYPILLDNPNHHLGLSIKLIMSHLACSDDNVNPFNHDQRTHFLELRRLLPLAPASLANSGGIFLGEAFHFNVVRPGTALYGLNPTPRHPNPMVPVASVWAKIYQTQSLQQGESVGYARTYQSETPQRLATIAMGYADGIPWLLGNQGTVSIAGFLAPILGRVSMDLLSIDVTHVPEALVFPGQWVNFFGQTQTPEDHVHCLQTSSLELLLRLGNRLKRVYGKEDDVTIE